MKRFNTTLAVLVLCAFGSADAACNLRQSTASQAHKLGPFLDSTDGITAETALTIDAADIRLSPAAGNMVSKNSGGGTHDELGVYDITFDATDTATVGILRIDVAETGALPVWDTCYVYEEAVYDNLFDAGAVGPLSAAAVNAEADTALSDYDPPTDAEMDARTLVAASYFDPTADAVANVTLVATTTTNTDNAALATAISALNDFDPANDTVVNVTNVAQSSVDEIQVTALADLFNTDSGTTHASAVSGSVVSEIADNAGGSALTAAAIVDEWETQSQADPTGFHVNVKEWNGDAASVALGLESGADVADAIRTEPCGTETTDTLGDLICNDVEALEARLTATRAGYIDALSGHVAQSGDNYNILGTPSDFGSGTSTIAANLRDLADDGTAVYDRSTDSHQAQRDTLALEATVAGLNDLSTAQVNTEVDTALGDIRLDELISASLASQPTAGSLLGDLTEDDAGTQRFTTNALEQGPSGGGGGTNITQIEGVDATDQIDASVDARLAAYDPPTRAELTSDIAGLNDLSAAQVNAEVDTALSDYDPPTRAELTSDIAGLNDPTASAIAAAVLAGQIETQGAGYDLQCTLATLLAYSLGELSTSSGVSTFQDPGGNVTRAVGTVSGSTRNAITITCP